MTPNISAETGIYLIRKHTATKETQLDFGLREEGLEQRGSVLQKTLAVKN